MKLSKNKLHLIDETIGCFAEWLAIIALSYVCVFYAFIVHFIGLGVLYLFSISPYYHMSGLVVGVTAIYLLLTVALIAVRLYILIKGLLKKEPENIGYGGTVSWDRTPEMEEQTRNLRWPGPNSEEKEK